MAKTKISEYDSTAANNTDIDGINIAESCAPSGINNAIREQMAHLKDGLGAGTPVFLDQTNNRVGINKTTPKESLNSGAIVVEGDHATGVNAMGSSAGMLLHATGDTGFVSAASSGNNNRNLQLRALNTGSANANQLFLSHTGDVGIGTATITNPYSQTPHTDVNIDGTWGGVISFKMGGAEKGYIGQRSSGNEDMLLAASTGQELLFLADNTERCRMDTSAHVMFGLSTANSFPTGNNFVQINETSGVNIVVGGHSGTHTIMQFRHNGATTIGSIVIDASSTTYNTSSDYRLKENVTDISDGITRVKQLAPKRFNFIADADKTVDGFIAHEAATVIPEAVSGEKDAMTEEVLYVDGDEIPEGKKVGDVKTASTIDPQGIDQSKIVPLLTAALQEAIAKIETLETKVAALEAE